MEIDLYIWQKNQLKGYFQCINNTLHYSDHSYYNFIRYIMAYYFIEKNTVSPLYYTFSMNHLSILAC